MAYLCQRDATIAVFIALGGVGWAAASIDSRDVKDNSLQSIDLKDGKGVKGADVAPDSLSGGAINESSLAQVPSAGSADSATDADALDGKDSDAFQGLGSEGWTKLPLRQPDIRGCGWVNAPKLEAPWPDASYMRDQDGFVHLRGRVRLTSLGGCGGEQNDSVITDGVNGNPLPPGYRPAGVAGFPVLTNNTLGALYVSSDINIPFTDIGNMRAWVELDGVSFRCAPSGQNGCP